MRHFLDQLKLYGVPILYFAAILVFIWFLGWVMHHVN